MTENIVNKQISIDQILEAARYLETYKQKYYNYFFQVKQNAERQGIISYDYKNGSAQVYYTIKFKDGRSVKENNYNWFVGNITNPKDITEIIIDMSIYYYTRSKTEEKQYDYNNIRAFLMFGESIIGKNNSNASLEISTTLLENEGNELHEKIKSIIESNDDRYNNTIKNKKIRIASFCISIGIILSYVVYFIYIMFRSNLSQEARNFLSDKAITIVGQWIIAVFLGYTFSFWYIIGIYNPISPSRIYKGRGAISNNKIYEDNIENYTKYSEIQFGNLWDAKERREKIEKIFKMSKICIMIQVGISLLMAIIMK